MSIAQMSLKHYFKSKEARYKRLYIIQFHCMKCLEQANL